MRILFETGNKGKLKEVKAIFAGLGHEIEQLEDDCPEIQADTLEEVVEAALKWLWEKHRSPVMIDDSGLFIDSLKGFPGVYSAYALKTLGCQGLLKLMDGMDERGAEFRCCAGYVDAKGDIITRSGIVRGRIIREMRGDGGFGFDPIFAPEGYDMTFAELELGIKNRISHRGRAFTMLADAIQE